MESRSVVFTGPLLLDRRPRRDVRGSRRASVPQHFGRELRIRVLASRLPCRRSAMRTQLALNRLGLLHRLRSAAGAGLLAIAVAGCGHVQPHLVLPDLKIGEPAFAATITGYTEAPIVAGNRIDVLLNGDEIFPAKLKLIKDATKTINYAQYVFEEGQPADDVARALAERCRAGVQVNVLVDAVGAMAMPAGQRQTHDRGGVPRRDVPPAPALHARHGQLPQPSPHPGGGRADRHHGGIRARAASGAAMAGRKANGATPTSGSRAPSSCSCRAPSSRTGSRRRVSHWAATTISPVLRRRAVPAMRRPCAAPPRAAASRCTRCSSSPWRRPSGRSTSPTPTSCPTTR